MCACWCQFEAILRALAEALAGVFNLLLPCRDRYRRRSPSPRRDRDRYRSSRYSPAPRDSHRRRSPIAPYYQRPRRTPPRHGTTLFVAGLNFVTSERVRSACHRRHAWRTLR